MMKAFKVKESVVLSAVVVSLWNLIHYLLTTNKVGHSLIQAILILYQPLRSLSCKEKLLLNSIVLKHTCNAFCTVTALQPLLLKENGIMVL